jgi:hypothetical protein
LLNGPHIAIQRHDIPDRGKYKAGTKCGKPKGTVVCKADGLCYYSFANGTNFIILPGFGDSIVFVTYPATSCDAMDAEFTTIRGR